MRSLLGLYFILRIVLALSLSLHYHTAGPEEANLRWSGQEQGYTWIYFQLGIRLWRAPVSTPKLGGSGGMLPQENFEIYNP